MRLVRVFFKKADRGIYISHLDLNRAMQRAIKRSKLNVWYTQGYNPHMYLTFALPLSLGFEGMCESMDIKVLGEESNDEIKEVLSNAFPPCIELIDVCGAQMDAREIAWADYEITFEAEESVVNDFVGFANLDEIITEKKSKKGMTEVNIAPMFRIIDKSYTNPIVKLTLRVAAGNVLNLNPTLILQAFAKQIGKEIEYDTIRRVAIYTEQEIEWR